MLRIIFLLRFLCFIAVVYLALHVIVLRLSRKPDSKLLWFFSVLTAPLMWPIRKWLASAVADHRLPSAALFFYALLWLLLVVIDQVLTR